MSRAELIAKGWSPIESAPTDGAKIIGMCSEQGYQEVVCWIDGAWRYADREYTLAADLWMPIVPATDLIDWQQKAIPLMQAAATWMPSKKCAAHIREIEALVSRAKAGGA